jgi:hypothetical protein
LARLVLSGSIARLAGSAPGANVTTQDQNDVKLKVSRWQFYAASLLMAAWIAFLALVAAWQL